MDTTKPSSFSAASGCTAHALCAQLQTAAPPLVIDVRKTAGYESSPCMLAGALRRDPSQVADWAGALPAGVPIVVYCVHGHEVSQGCASALNAQGVNAQYLQGGIEHWQAQGLPLFTKPLASSTRWVTRERPKIDRIACPWLVRRFIDAHAQFLYVPSAQVQAVAQAQQATPFDVNTNVASTPFTHDDEQCSFDAFIKLYRLGADTALARLADIVRGADTDLLDLAPQAAGLLAVSLGMSRNYADDTTMLDAMMPVYDALYTWCRDAVAGTDEQHNWKPA
jgi:rhodanese-related sulfurtransferase